MAPTEFVAKLFNRLLSEQDRYSTRVVAALSSSCDDRILKRTAKELSWRRRQILLLIQVAPRERLEAEPETPAAPAIDVMLARIPDDRARGLKREKAWPVLADKGEVLLRSVLHADRLHAAVRTDRAYLVGYAAKGAGEVVTDEAGAVIVAGGADEFSDSVLRLLQDGNQRAALADKGKVYAR